MAKKDVARIGAKANKFHIKEITWTCPDPAWEYSEVWHQLQQSKKEIDAVLTNLQNLEYVSFENDKQVRPAIKAIKERLGFVADILSD